ncbi:hypothetical protein MRX96_010505 [Rhipicephalus microplus]
MEKEKQRGGGGTAAVVRHYAFGPFGSYAARSRPYRTEIFTSVPDTTRPLFFRATYSRGATRDHFPYRFQRGPLGGRSSLTEPPPRATPRKAPRPSTNIQKFVRTRKRVGRWDRMPVPAQMLH